MSTFFGKTDWNTYYLESSMVDDGTELNLFLGRYGVGSDRRRCLQNRGNEHCEERGRRSEAHSPFDCQKDTQRVAEITRFELPADGKNREIGAEAELSTGQELVFLPLISDHHNGANFELRNLTISGR